MPLVLVCADTAAQRRQLLVQLQAQLASAHGEAPLLVLDLSGSGGALASVIGPTSRWQPYAAEAWADQIWQQLVPVLQPWSELLEGALDLLERPASREIPGLDALLCCLYLADQCAGEAAVAATAVVVVLPPLEQALPLLQLACRGPDLLEGLWRPLLLWWSQTRDRLAQFELVLRLRLPAAAGLELSQRWRSCLEGLAQRLDAATAAPEVLLALASGPEDLGDLGPRIAAIPLCGLPRLRLWLDGDLAGAAAAALEQQFALPVLIGPAARIAPHAPAWLAAPLPAATTLWDTQNGIQRCRLYLPGLQRQGLQVQRRDQSLQIRSGGLRLVVPLPGGWSALQCRSARLEAPWLVIDFS